MNEKVIFFRKVCSSRYDNLKTNAVFYQVNVKIDLGAYSIIFIGAGLNKDSIEKVPSVAKSIVPMKVIPDICHRHHRRCLWRTNLPCGEMSPHGKFGKKSVMGRSVEKNLSCGE